MFADRFRAWGVNQDSLWVCYAMAENAFAVTAAGGSSVPVVVTQTTAESFARGVIDGVEVEQSIELVSVGAPIEGCEVRVVDGERKMLADGHVGEVALRSSYMLREYYRDSEATERAIDDEGWYYTGDLGFCLDGQLYITGREKDLLIVGGRNFYPQDIESVADTCPHAVAGRSVAIGVDDERTGTQRIVLLVESKTEDPAEIAELTAAVRERVLETLDCPLSELHVVPHMWLLKTTSGKIARSPNLERFRQEMSETAEARTDEPGGFPLLSTLGWGFLLAAALYTIFLFQPNLSWGVYAGF
jgi:acyl-CoA synthetase (AMP-forming)/AMP-acid ligase II